MSRGRRRGSTPPGVFLVDKPAGPTSHDVVQWVRWALRTTQVGHCGTLDPAATGLLMVCVGAATKLVPWMTAADKVYRGRFVLGRSTTTDDAQGETTATSPCDAQVLASAEATLGGMLGTLMLPPPAYSAIHVDGERAHEKARRGDTVTLPPREMVVHSIADVVVGGLERAGELVVDATVHVSKGTYIRSLAVELGRRLGVPAHLGALRRLACADASVDDPHAVGPLAVQALPPAVPGAPPKWRIRPAGMEEAEREAQGHWLADRRRAPWVGLSIPVVELSRTDPDAAALLTRLCYGQPAALDDPGWPSAAPADEAAIVSPAPPHEGETRPAAVIVVQREGAQIRPRRVVTPA